MEITERDAKRIILIIMFAVLTILTFLIVRPVILSIFGGLILAYICFPIYKVVVRYVKWEGLSAAIVSIIIVALIFIPMWFLVPMVIQQTFGLFQQSQSLDISSVITKVLPTASEQLIQQLDLTLKNAMSKVSSSVLNSLLGVLTNFVSIVLHAAIVAFVFFFALKDEARFRKFASEISPLSKSQEKVLVTQFKDMTNSILYGHVVAGLLQGILAGVAILVFGIPNAILLTVLAIIFGVVPILGPGLVYVPATVYLIALGQPGPAIIYFLYNVIVVTSIDNIFRIYLVSRKVKISQVIVLIGMVGGLLLFGFLGLLIGPLVLGYFITLVEAYKNKTLSSFFSEE